MHLLILKLIGFLRLKRLAMEYKPILFLYNYVISSNSSYIGINCHFESAPNFPHGIKGIFISGDSKIGENVTIFQGVTIGSNTLIDSKGKGAPIIGDNCYIGAGAKIIGNLTIGNNCRIGANTVVVEDCPDNSLIVNPKSAIMIREKKMDNSFYFRDGGEWAKLVEGKSVKVIEEDKIKQLNS